MSSKPKKTDKKETKSKPIKVGGKTYQPGELVKPTGRKAPKTIEQERRDFDRIYGLTIPKLLKDKKNLSVLGGRGAKGVERKRFKNLAVVGADESCGAITNPFTLRRVEVQSRLGREVMKLSITEYDKILQEQIDKNYDGKKGEMKALTYVKIMEGADSFKKRKKDLRTNYVRAKTTNN
jgi:hypothetical protein